MKEFAKMAADRFSRVAIAFDPARGRVKIEVDFIDPI